MFVRNCLYFFGVLPIFLWSIAYISVKDRQYLFGGLPIFLWGITFISARDCLYNCERLLKF